MRRRSAFTLTELCVVLLIIGGMAALLFPVHTHHNNRKGKQIQCLSNMKQQGLALMMYAQDYDEKLPVSPSGWMDLSLPYVKSWNIFRCPSLGVNEYGYAFDARIAGKKQATLVNPDQLLLLLESTDRRKNAYSSGEGLSARHDGWGSLVYADGHARSLHHKKETAPVFTRL